MQLKRPSPPLWSRATNLETAGQDLSRSPPQMAAAHLLSLCSPGLLPSKCPTRRMSLRVLSTATEPSRSCNPWSRRCSPPQRSFTACTSLLLCMAACKKINEEGKWPRCSAAAQLPRRPKLVYHDVRLFLRKCRRIAPSRECP